MSKISEFDETERFITERTYDLFQQNMIDVYISHMQKMTAKACGNDSWTLNKEEGQRILSLTPETEYEVHAIYMLYREVERILLSREFAYSHISLKQIRREKPFSDDCSAKSFEITKELLMFQENKNQDFRDSFYCIKRPLSHLEDVLSDMIGGANHNVIMEGYSGIIDPLICSF
jgi:hypothetical protein